MVGIFDDENELPVTPFPNAFLRPNFQKTPKLLLSAGQKTPKLVRFLPKFGQKTRNFKNYLSDNQ